MHKILILETDNFTCKETLVTLLNEGWVIVNATAICVSTAKPYHTEIGTIVYILKKS